MFNHGKVPFGRLLLALSAGVALGYFSPFPLLFPWSGIIQALLLAIILFILLFFRKFGAFRWKGLAAVLVYVNLAFAGYILTAKTGAIPIDHFSRLGSEFILAQVSEEPIVRGSSQRFKSSVLLCLQGPKEVRATGNLMISLKIPPDSLIRLPQYGDIIMIPGKYTALQAPFNPGEFDYRKWLSLKQIYHQTYLNEASFIIIKRNTGNPIIADALLLRRSLVSKLEMFMPDKQASSLVATLLLGYRAELERHVIQTFSNTGTMHILSVSGMHVALIYLVLGFLLKFLGKGAPGRIMRTVIILGLLWWYAMLTGFSAPASRAALMISFVVLGDAFSRTNNAYNSLCVSAFCLLIYNPYYLFDAGFQLSYLAVLGLITLQPKLYNWFSIDSWAIDQVWKYSSISLAAQFATLPLSIYYFHKFPLYFLLSNLLIVLPTAIIMYLGILLLAMPFDEVCHIAGIMLSWLVIQTNGVLYIVEKLPSASLSGLWITGLEAIILHILIVFTIIRLYSSAIQVNYIMSLTIILLSLSIAIRSLKQAESKQAIFYNLNRNFAISFISSGKAVTFSDLPDGHTAFEYTLKPGVEKSGAEQVEFVPVGKKFQSKEVYAAGNIIQLRNFRLLLWTDSLTNTSAKRIDTDAVYIRGNPRSSVRQFKRIAKFRWIIADGSNSDYRINEIKQQARAYSIPVFVLKKSPALIISI